MGTILSLSLALLSGLLLALAFPPLEWSLLAFLGLVPLVLAAASAPSPRRAFLLGWLAGLAYFTGVVWWVTVAVINYGYLPAPVGWGVVLLMTSYLALYPAVFAVAARWAGRRGWTSSPAGVLFLAAAWTGLEWVRGNLSFLAFPWANLAYTQYLRLPFIQSASLSGPYGPGFLVAAGNLGLLCAGKWLTAAGAARRRAAAGFLLAALLISADCLWGLARLRRGGEEGPPLPVAVAQGNIEQSVKWNRAYRESTMDIYETLTGSAIKEGAALVIWPESATPFFFQMEAGYQKRMFDLVRRTGSPLLFGAPAFEDGEGSLLLRNRAYLIERGGNLDGYYDKMHLVPFGEYVPLKRLFFFAGKLVKEVGDFTPGEERRLFRAGDERFGTVICYEIIFPDLVRRFVRDGAGFMTTITNDAWYGRTSASWQHFTQMVFRAVENGVPVARAANTGISGFVDARGRIVFASDLFVRGEWTREIRPGRGRTFYTARGDLFAWLCLAVLGVWMAAAAAGRLAHRGRRARR